jgi:hypothetical protein
MGAGDFVKKPFDVGERMARPRAAIRNKTCFTASTDSQAPPETRHLHSDGSVEEPIAVRRSKVRSPLSDMSVKYAIIGLTIAERTAVNTALALLILLVAAILEAGGDALVRTGLHGDSIASRAGLFAGGAAVLFAYGVSVNAPPWDFGKLLGVYVALFFVVAQIINLIFFGVSPTLPVIIGGAMILSGGLVMTLWRV